LERPRTINVPASTFIEKVMCPMKQGHFAKHFIAMQDDQDREAEEAMHDDQDREAEEAMRAAENLVRSQEAEVARIKSKGIDARWAEGLLEAYRVAARLAREHWQALRGFKSEGRNDE
jgi:hypothetical protein